MTETAPAQGTVGRVKFTSLEAGRGFAALMVVLFHCNETGSGPRYFGYETLTAFRGGYSGVEFFFVLSGFVIFLAHRNDFAENRGTARFLWKRFQRLYPTLWVIIVPLILLMLFVPALRWAGSLSATDIVAALTIVPYPDERVLTVEWTLRYEVAFYVLFAIALRWRWVASVLCLVWIAAGLVSLWFTPKGIVGFFVAPYPLIFVAGVVVAVGYRRLPPHLAVASVFVGMTIYIGWLTHLAVAATRVGTLPLDVVVFGLGAATMVAGLARTENLGRIVAPRILCFLGAASYSIYLVHYPAMSVFMKVAMRLRAVGLPDWIAIAFVLVASVGAGVVCHMVIEKPLLKTTKRLGDWYLERRRAARSLEQDNDPIAPV